jgi:hypothetical protein
VYGGACTSEGALTVPTTPVTCTVSNTLTPIIITNGFTLRKECEEGNADTGFVIELTTDPNDPGIPPDTFEVTLDCETQDLIAFPPGSIALSEIPPEGYLAPVFGGLCAGGSVTLNGTVSGVLCTVTNTLDPDGDGDGGEDPACPVCCPCGLDVDIDINNDNNNDIDIDNDNANNNANNNANANDNANANENENNSENTNEQNQTNNQDQSNANDQTNNIDSSPEVNISGSLKKPAPAPSTSAGGAAITPPSTGDAGLSRGNGAAEAVGVVLMIVVVTGLGVAGLRAACREG